MKGFVPDEIVEDAEVFVLAQGPGGDEEREGRPMVGRTGDMMEREFFPRASLERGHVSIGNVIRCRWQRNGTRTNDLPPEAILKPAMAQCQEAYFRPPPSTKLIVAQGALAWRAMGQDTSIMKWRGFLAPEA